MPVPFGETECRFLPAGGLPTGEVSAVTFGTMLESLAFASSEQDPQSAGGTRARSSKRGHRGELQNPAVVRVLWPRTRLYGIRRHAIRELLWESIGSGTIVLFTLFSQLSHV